MSSDLATPAPTCEQISPGVFSYVQPDGTWGINNSGFLVGDESVLVVDSCVTEARTRLLQAAIHERTDAPVTILFNTHHHRDHTFGNYLFRPATIVGHRLCREEVLRLGLGPKEVIPARDFGHIEVAPPDLVFDESLTLYREGLRLDAIYLGPAHTSNDAVLYLPERRLLFAGDLAFNGGAPYAAEGSIAGWKRALEQLQELDVDLVVPGHGDVCGPEVFDAMAGYFAHIDEVAARAVTDGLTPPEAAEAADLSPYDGWTCPERHVVNIHCGMLERDAGSAPPKDPAVFLEEMQQALGKPPRSLA